MKPVFSAFAFLILTTVVGCGGVKTAPVTGTVTYNGNPVPDVNVLFTGKEGARATASTDSSGKLKDVTTAKGGDGAVPGDYTVTVTPKTVSTENPTAEEYAVPDPNKKPAFPLKYSDPNLSDLKVTVGSGNNDLKLELKD